jgi:hypothetical protein
METCFRPIEGAKTWVMRFHFSKHFSQTITGLIFPEPPGEILLSRKRSDKLVTHLAGQYIPND